MAPSFSPSRFAPPALLYLLLFSIAHRGVFGIDITNLLSNCSDVSQFSSLLSSTAVAADLASRSSITVLAVPNAFIQTSDLAAHHSSGDVADVLRYHIILEYLSWTDLRLIPPAGKVFPTLFQTTGRASVTSGFLNITRNPSSGEITIHSANSNATVLSQLKTVPYNVSVFSIDSILIPNEINLMASETRPPLGLNITKALIDGHDFNVAASMLTASGVEAEFEEDEGGAGITLFIPTDDAFSDSPARMRFQSLTADEKAVVLRFHVLHSYYPLGSLESVVNPYQPTLATEKMGAASFLLNLSRLNGSVLISSGISHARVTQTVFDQNPVAIFGISSVLLPKEYFGDNPIAEGNPISGGKLAGEAPPPDAPLSPESSQGLPPEGSDTRSGAAAAAGGILTFRVFLGLWCIGLYLSV